MKLTLQIESGRKNDSDQVVESKSSKPTVSDGWPMVMTAWQRANEPGIDETERGRRLNWVGGALSMLAELTGEDPVELRSRLESKKLVQAEPQLPGMPTFREGRSTPPPPPHPGAQRAVE